MLRLIDSRLSACDEALASEALHRSLDDFNRERLSPRLPLTNQLTDGEAQLRREHTMRRIELRFVESERARIVAWARKAPHDPAQFLTWFEGLRDEGPGQHDALFVWLAEHASYEEMLWFLRQETAGEAGFDDLVALTQVKMPMRPKLELARNYWDEMGRGKPSAMHGPMLERLNAELGIADGGDAVWESLALANLMTALATHRAYAYQSIGALGVIEMTAPWRAERVNAGLKRLGVDGEARRYFALHATLDVKHSIAWNAEVLEPLVAQQPAAAQAIAEGALLRLQAGARCFDRYKRELGLQAPSWADTLPKLDTVRPARAS